MSTAQTNEEIIAEIESLKAEAGEIAEMLESDLRSAEKWDSLWAKWREIENLHIVHCHVMHILPENFVNPEKGLKEYADTIGLFLASDRVNKNPQWKKPDAVVSLREALKL